MLWQITIAKEQTDQLPAAITVAANNWYSALKNGLDRYGLDGTLLSHLSCKVNPDKSVAVTDFITRSVYTLRAVETNALAKGNGDVDITVKSAVREDIAPHQVFFSRDEAPEREGGVLYRERLIRVASDMDKEQAGALVYAYFDRLKALGAPPGLMVFISIQVFDRAAHDHAYRPPLAALTWRAWQRDKPTVRFPLLGDEGIMVSMRPLPGPGVTMVHARRSPSKQKGVTGLMVQAFEQMQRIYGIRDWDEAAACALQTAISLIDCSSGACMLIPQDTHQLYVAAAAGPIAETIQGKHLSARMGIAGFAMNTGVVVTVSNVQNDDLFTIETDEIRDFETQNIACAPIQHEGRIHGVIVLINSPRQGGFTQTESNVLAYLAGFLAEYIETALLSGGNALDNEKR